MIDFTVVWAGPYATMHLADWGAEVIRVESRQHLAPNTRGQIAKMKRAMGANNPNADGFGAGGAATPGSAQDFVVNVGDRVFCDTDMSNIREDGRQTLNRQAEWLKKYTQ